MSRLRLWWPLRAIPTAKLYTHELICDDCGASDHRGRIGGYTSPIASDGETRIYCDGCKRRRGLAYLFDPRPWREIAASAEPRGAA